MSTKLNQQEMQALVNDMLENAVVENGYTELLDWSDYDIACDLIAYGQDALPVQITKAEDLTRYVHEWKLVQER